MTTEKNTTKTKKTESASGESQAKEKAAKKTTNASQTKKTSSATGVKKTSGARQAKSTSSQTQTREEAEEKKDFEIDINEMGKNGVHLGHRVSKLHPSMEDFIIGIRNTTHVLDLDQTAEWLSKALNYIQRLTQEGGQMVIVSTKTPLRSLVRQVAEEIGVPYVTERWLGGTFTNFDVIKKRVDYLKELERQKQAGEWDKYTKKEKVDLERELEDLQTRFGGIKKMEKLPEAVFIVDMTYDDTCLREAEKRDITTIGIADTNADFSRLDYPIPANDDAISSVSYILERLKKVMGEKSVNRKP